jgi:hypothetical protein
MTTSITTTNFDQMKYRLLLTVSSYGNIINPQDWYNKLSVYEFENESVECMVTSYLFDQYHSQLNKFRKSI